jgi:murein DD-endopeptidase MepM/ murein hydrolase activator NlpD
MIRKTLLTLLFSGLLGSLSAQDLTLTSDYNTRNQFVISVQKNAPGTHYIEINFTELRNAAPVHLRGIQSFTAKSNRQLTTISPASDVAPTVRYSYRYWLGNPESRPDEDFVYRLPYSEAVERRIDSLYLIGRGHRTQEYNFDWHSMQFNMQPGDTIYAARAGVVVRVREAEEEENSASPHPDGRMTFKRNVNRVEVEHADGTYAEYSVLENVTVRPGEQVWPHTPIGLAGSYDGKDYQIRLTVYYHRLPPRGKTYENSRFEYHYLRPLFLTEEGVVKLIVRETYRPVTTVDLLTREMPRRMARQFEK